MVQVCTLNCHTGCTFGEQTWTITDRGAHLNPKYSCLQSKKHFCTLKGANLNPKGCKMKGAGLHSGRCTDSFIWVQTSTLKGANLSWLHLYGCKLAFVVQDCALKGGCWYCDIFGGANLYLYFLVCTLALHPRSPALIPIHPSTHKTLINWWISWFRAGLNDNVLSLFWWQTGPQPPF